MATVAVARFRGVLRTSGTPFRKLRTIAGPSSARIIAGNCSSSSSSSINKRCMSTFYAPSHEYMKKVRTPCLTYETSSNSAIVDNKQTVQT